MPEKEIHCNSTSRITSRRSTLSTPIRLCQALGVPTNLIVIQATPTVLSTHADQTIAYYYCFTFAILSGLNMVLTLAAANSSRSGLL
eukprot:s6584_g2.t1